MAEFGFGQPRGGIVQTAYVVPDVRAAIAAWVADLGVGPWFLLEHFTGVDAVYRGEPSRADVAIAMAFAGHMQIELIQPLDDAPSVYRETVQQRGWGFHHVGLATDDLAADVAAREAAGATVAFRAGVPTGGTVVYLDGGPALPGFVELIEGTAGMDDMFTRYWLASVGWDGRDPVRPFG
ncbi:VOC family protein [Modestobacter lapidis]|nr:VOC family protein [Modestobacter lapidis]